MLWMNTLKRLNMLNKDMETRNKLLTTCMVGLVLNRGMALLGIAHYLCRISRKVVLQAIACYLSRTLNHTDRHSLSSHKWEIQMLVICHISNRNNSVLLSRATCLNSLKIRQDQIHSRAICRHNMGRTLTSHSIQVQI